MKKVEVLAILLLLVFSLSSLVFAVENETSGEVEKDDIQEAFDCLEEKAGTCSKLTTQEIALTILATPDNIFDDCIKELEDREKSNNWGNVRDTALAVLALKHAGKDTKAIEEWLLEQEETPAELVWYTQQDSNEATQCHVGYSAKDYTISIGDNKKIDSGAGTCLTLAQSDFWLEINPNCYEEEFLIECDKDFIANLLYRNRKSSTIYVLEGTQSAPAYGSISLKVRSKCFGSGSCDYEATVWATLALLKTGHNVDDFIPYIIAMSDTNEKYLPEAFVYMLTNYEDYATQLVANQKLGNYWEADFSIYNRYYDTALALLALGSSSSEQIPAAENWLLFSQGSNGCWQNSVRDTAMVLWALEGRAGRTPTDSGVSVTYCSEADYFCIPKNDCPSNEDVGDNFYCSSLSDTCCTNENLKTCSEYAGQACLGDTFCVGNERRSSDVEECCTGTCEDRPEENECEANFYSCSDSCFENQEPVDYSCDGDQVCCRTKVTDVEKKSLWWLWLILVLVLVTLGALSYVYREKLKEEWNKIKAKMGKGGKGGAPSRGPGGPGRPGMPPRGMPPRPGFPPVVRQQPPTGRMRPGYREDPAMKETFRKLRRIATR